MILASYIRPFDAKQKIYVLNGKKETEEVRICSLENFSNEVLQLVNEYQISELELHGNETLCEDIQKQIAVEELSKYNKSELKITIKGA